MRKWFVAAAILLNLCSECFAAFGIFTTYQPVPVPDVLCDITTGNCTGTGGGSSLFTAATCNGVADDAAAFTSFNSWVTGTWQPGHTGLVGLSIPSGKTCEISSNTVDCGIGLLACPFAGIKRLAVIMYGATLHPNNALLGVAMLQDTNTKSMRLQTVNAGDTCATVTANATGGAGDVSIYTVGNYGLLTGFDMQGLWNDTSGSSGFPPNPYYYEWLKVASKSSTLNCAGGAGASVTFTSAAQKTYLSTWPHWTSGLAGLHIDQGGPATLYNVVAPWDTEVEFRGGTLFNASNQIGASGRLITFRDVTFQGTLCLTTSQTQTYNFINSSGVNCSNTGNGVEVDKIVGTINLTGGTWWGFHHQSASPDLFAMNGATITNRIDGTPKRFTDLNSTIPTLNMGPSAYGRANEVYLSGTNLGAIGDFGATQKGPSDAGINVGWTMSGGVFTIPNTQSAGADNNQTRGLVPGTNFMFQGTGSSELLGQVTSVTQDPTNTFVATTFSGGFPNIPLTGGKLFLHVHPAPKFTCISCTGTAGLLANNYPVGGPLYSYLQYTMDGSTGTTPQPTNNVWGNLSSVSIFVTNAYSGAGSLSYQTTQFNNWLILNSLALSSGTSQVNYGPIVNAKIAGNRVITPSGATGSQTGDSALTFPDAVLSWSQGPIAPTWSANVSASCPGAGCPSVTVTVQANQGVVNPPY